MMGCSVLESGHLLGKKWTIPILEEIATVGFDGFNRFIAKTPGITPSTLSHELKELEAANIIQRMPSHETSDSTHYILTHKGEELYKIIEILKEWSGKWNTASPMCANASCLDCAHFKDRFLHIQEDAH